MLSNFRAEGLKVDRFDIDNGQFIECQIGFSIAARSGRGVVQISEIGMKVPEKTMAEKYVVMACLNKLANNGYNLPTLSSMMLQAIDAGWYHDVLGLCARIARSNQTMW
jgi:hypothetical protein